MRIGLLDTWLAGRYLPFWEPYLEGLGLELVRPEPVEPSLPIFLPASLVAAQASNLKAQGVDYLLIPDAQGDIQSERGGAQNPWIFDLGASLARYLPGLPPMLRVPAYLSPDLVGFAAEVGQTLTKNPMLTRRVLDKTQYLLQHTPPLPKNPSSNRSVGIATLPMVQEDPRLQGGLVQALQKAGLSPFWPDIPSSRLREEGRRVEIPLDLPTDLEFAGASRYLSRLGKVRALIYLMVPGSDPIPNLARKLARRVQKPYHILNVGEDWSEALAKLAQQVGV
ncbi:hypothetical protein [Calidithermus timidus]|uniref:hypothetical protein n=1 Tax=Calidithermus timidus TaxID=307124 RepID=UPI00035CB3F8|nr:hypothetical protein [Calidithermus timidus]